MTEKDREVSAILANCVLQKRRECVETLGLTWDEGCILAAVSLALGGGHPPNITRIAEMCTMSHTTASRHVHKLTSTGWLTKNDTHPHPVYTRSEDPVKLKTLVDFIMSFRDTIMMTGCKLTTIEDSPDR